MSFAAPMVKDFYTVKELMDMAGMLPHQTQTMYNAIRDAGLRDNAQTGTRHVITLAAIRRGIMQNPRLALILFNTEIVQTSTAYKRDVAKFLRAYGEKVKSQNGRRPLVGRGSFEGLMDDIKKFLTPVRGAARAAAAAPAVALAAAATDLSEYTEVVNNAAPKASKVDSTALRASVMRTLAIMTEAGITTETDRNRFLRTLSEMHQKMMS